MLEAIAFRLEGMARRLEAIAVRLEAIVFRLEAIAFRLVVSEFMCLKVARFNSNEKTHPCEVDFIVGQTIHRNPLDQANRTTEGFLEENPS